MMKGGKGNGPSKIFLKNGRVFTGEQIEGRLSHGTLIKMQQDGTFNVYDVVYDHARDSASNIYPDLQVPISETLVKVDAQLTY